MNVTIPTSWNDITLEMYMKLRPVLETEQEPITKIINILCVLTGEKKEIIKDVSLTDYNKLINKMSFLNTDMPKETRKKRIKIKNQWYEWKLDPKNLLFGEYISVMEIMEKANNNENILFENLHKILTIICRPVERRFGFYWRSSKVTNDLIRETANNFYTDMSIADAYPIAVFFCSRYPNLMEIIKTSLNKKADKMIKKVKTEMRINKDLETIGVGGH